MVTEYGAVVFDGRRVFSIGTARLAQEQLGGMVTLQRTARCKCVRVRAKQALHLFKTTIRRYLALECNACLHFALRVAAKHEIKWHAGLDQSSLDPFRAIVDTDYADRTAWRSKQDQRGSHERYPRQHLCASMHVE